MKITRENYEEWMLDLIEGNLNAVEKAGVYDFLNKNPDLKAELEEFNSVVLIPEDSPRFNDKSSLKKSDTQIEGVDRNDYLLIGKTENVLATEELREYEVFVRTEPASRYYQKKYDEIKLKADTSVRYPEKNKLKRVVLIPFITRENFYRAAVVLILLMLISGSWFVLRPLAGSREKSMAELSVPAASTNIKDTGSSQSAVTNTEPDDDKQDQFKQTELSPVNKKTVYKTESLTALSDKRTMAGLTKLQKKGVDEVLKPVKLNGYEIALNRIMPLYISYLRSQDIKPVVKPNTADVRKDDTPGGLLAGGVKVLNKLTGSEIRIGKRYDERGDVVSYTFATPNLQINHKVKGRNEQ